MVSFRYNATGLANMMQYKAGSIWGKRLSMIQVLQLTSSVYRSRILCHVRKVCVSEDTRQIIVQSSNFDLFFPQLAMHSPLVRST